jgi:hypothetical protein
MPVDHERERVVAKGQAAQELVRRLLVVVGCALGVHHRDAQRRQAPCGHRHIGRPRLGRDHERGTRRYALAERRQLLAPASAEVEQAWR